MWVTDSANPNECVALRKPEIWEELIKTNKAFEATGYAYEHYLWTNDKSAIPKTVEVFEANGIKVRDLRELPSYDAEIAKVIDKYTISRFGAAADIARQIVIYDEGGVYLDIDAFVKEWDDGWL